MPTRFRPLLVAPAHAPPSRWLLCGKQGVVVRAAEGNVSFPTTADVEGLAIPPGDVHVLGAVDAETFVAAPLPAGVTLPAALSERPLRALFSDVDDLGFTIAGRAVQIVAWDETHRYCGRCATPTVREANERCRRCPKCALEAYPRVAPAIIVLVTRGDEALLARSAKFPRPFFSTLAGFVEPGETLEECIAREIKEEVGITVSDLRYFGSQPWPFPHSLMIGFLARHEAGEIVIDGEEIAEAAWFRRDALPMVPPNVSIAGRMIRRWVDGAT